MQPLHVRHQDEVGYGEEKATGLIPPPLLLPGRTRQAHEEMKQIREQVIELTDVLVQTREHLSHLDAQAQIASSVSDGGMWSGGKGTCLSFFAHPYRALFLTEPLIALLPARGS